MTAPHLELEDVHAGYDGTVILEGISMAVDRESVVSIIGRNGAGKTTTLRAIMGHVPVTGGAVRYDGKDLTNAPPEQVYRQGIGWVPEHREVFPDLTVEENLKMGATTTDSGWLTLEEAYEYFPRLRERRSNRGGQLSGGEQQMLAIARSLMGDTELLLLDEPTEGLAPQIVDDILDIVEQLRDDGITVLIVEQNLQAVLSVADHHYVLSEGTFVFDGTSDELEDADDVRRQHLSVSE